MYPTNNSLFIPNQPGLNLNMSSKYKKTISTNKIQNKPSKRNEHRTPMHTINRTQSWGDGLKLTEFELTNQSHLKYLKKNESEHFKKNFPLFLNNYNLTRPVSKLNSIPKCQIYSARTSQDNLLDNFQWISTCSSMPNVNNEISEDFDQWLPCEKLNKSQNKPECVRSCKDRNMKKITRPPQAKRPRIMMKQEWIPSATIYDNWKIKNMHLTKTRNSLKHKNSFEKYNNFDYLEKLIFDTNDTTEFKYNQLNKLYEIKNWNNQLDNEFYDYDLNDTYQNQNKDFESNENDEKFLFQGKIILISYLFT